MGGTDDPSNIDELTVYEHRCAHLKLYYQYGKKEDLCAYYMLSGNIEEFRRLYGHLGGKSTQKMRKAAGLNSYGLEPGSERQRSASRKAGLIQGPINAANGHMSKIQKLADCSSAGKKGSSVCRDRGVNAFFDPMLRGEICKAGGRAQR